MEHCSLILPLTSIIIGIALISVTSIFLIKNNFVNFWFYIVPIVIGFGFFIFGLDRVCRKYLETQNSRIQEETARIRRETRRQGNRTTGQGHINQVMQQVENLPECPKYIFERK